MLSSSFKSISAEVDKGLHDIKPAFFPGKSSHQVTETSKVPFNTVDSESNRIVTNDIVEVERFLASLKRGDTFSDKARIPYEHQLADLKTLHNSINASTTSTEISKEIKKIRDKYHPKDDE